MDYTSYEIEHFLLDKTFIQFCNGSNQDAVKFWTDWIAAHPGRAGLAQKAKSLYFQLNGNITEQEINISYLNFQQAFQERFGYKQLNTKKGYQFYPQLWLGIAACILITAGLFIYLDLIPVFQPTKNEIVYSSPLGQKKKVNLADGSVVILNGGSKLILSKNFNSSNREVRLEGEGYFEVHHNIKKPFIVNTAMITIRDLGTIFNIKAYKGDQKTEATLIEGVIEVAINKDKSKKTIMSPRKKYSIQNFVQPNGNAPLSSGAGSVIISDVKVLPQSNGIVETDWTENKLSFYSEPFEEIAKQMERWYNVKIIIKNPQIKTNLFTASFDHQEITKVLEALKLSGNFSYRKEKDVIIIY